MSGWVNLTAAARLLGRTKSTTLAHACRGRIRTRGYGYDTEYSVEDVERLRAENESRSCALHRVELLEEPGEQERIAVSTL